MGAALGIVRSAELARQERPPHVLAVLFELLGRKRLGAANELAGDPAPRAALALAVLHRLHLHVLPVLAKAADDAAMACALAIGVVPALPHADRREVRRLRPRPPPPVARVVGNAVHADFSARPGLRRRPLDAKGDVARLARIVVAQGARRASGAPRSDAQANVAVRHPLFRI